MIKDRNGKDITEAEEIKKRWQEYPELYEKGLNGPDNHDGIVRRQGSQVSMRVARRSASWLSSHGRGIATQDILKHSRGLSRVAAENPGFPQLVPVTSGSFSLCL